MCSSPLLVRETRAGNLPWVPLPRFQQLTSFLGFREVSGCAVSPAPRTQDWVQAFAHGCCLGFMSSPHMEGGCILSLLLYEVVETCEPKEQ